MGRSVDYLNNAEVVIYFPLSEVYNEEGEYDQDIAQIQWDDMVYDLISTIKRKLPSYQEEKNKWDGRETRIILSNSFCNIGLSEYCGLVSLSVAPKDSDDLDSFATFRDNFAVRHAKQIEKTLQNILDDLTGSRLKKIGTFSNGEAVFEKAV